MCELKGTRSKLLSQDDLVIAERKIIEKRTTIDLVATAKYWEPQTSLKKMMPLTMTHGRG